MFDYNKFFTENSVNIHDQPERHSFVSDLCVGSVLDIGCGTGSLSDYYKGDYTGGDISSVAIEKAIKHRRKNAIFKVCDFVNPKNIDFSKFDTIVLAEFLEHIENDDLLFNQIKETAHPGTKIIISVPNFNSVPSPDHVRVFTPSQIRSKFSKFGTVEFYDWVGSDKRIIFSFQLGIFQPQILTLAIIAKNEEKGIERALLSGLAHSDQIIVGVDSATTDKTREIAKRYADYVFDFKWQDDFSGARNCVLKRIQTPWVLWLDGHEYLETPPKRHLLANSDFDAVMCQNRLDNGVVVRYPRLHLSSLRYEDKVHNKLVAKNIDLKSDVLIVHDRVNGQSSDSVKEREIQRNDMILRIMGKQIKENKKNTRASMHLGLHFHSKHDYKKAIKNYKLYLRFSKYSGERWYVRFNLVLCLLSLKKSWLAEYNALLLEKESPGRWETQHVLGLVFLFQKKFDIALHHFIKSLENKEQESDYKPIQRDLSASWNFIGECFFNLQKYYEASEAFNRASKHAKDDQFKSLLIRRSRLMRDMSKELQK